MEKKSELVGLKAMTGRAVGMKKRLVVFDEPLHATTCTIDGFVDERGLTTVQVGDDKARIFLPRSGDLGFGDDASWKSPSICLVKEAGK